MDIKSIIQKKSKKQELTQDEIKYTIGKYAKEEITEAQMAALMSYICMNGLTEDEIVYFTQNVAETGNMLDLKRILPNIVDKHSTGGVGDKATILLVPIMASLDIPVAKISSKGYGIAGGTIDKLESIPGFDTGISIETFIENVRENRYGHYSTKL